MLLVGGRIALPFIVHYHVNSVLANMDGYKGHVEEVELDLYHGAYLLKNMEVDYPKGKMPIPFFKAALIDVSIDWNALVKGHVVGRLEFEEPVLNFSINRTGTESQTGVEHNWAITIKKLTSLNININEAVVHKGTVQFKDYSKSPVVELSITDLELKGSNLYNITGVEETLPPPFVAWGQAPGGGVFKMQGGLNLLKEIPDVDLNLSLTNSTLTSLSNFSDAYAGFKFQDGQFSMFAEMYLEDANYEGYLKLLFDHMMIGNRLPEDQTLPIDIWAGFLNVMTELFENQRKDRLATKAPFKGSVQDPDVPVLALIVNIFKNTLINAIPKKLDESIGTEDL